MNSESIREILEDFRGPEVDSQIEDIERLVDVLGQLEVDARRRIETLREIDDAWSSAYNYLEECAAKMDSLNEFDGDHFIMNVRDAVRYLPW